MRRTERLFQIIQVLRSRNTAVTGQELATELEVSLRTLYRDMAELTAQRIPIRGEAGTGYLLEDGYDMPPLMLTADELEAAALGAAWVAAQGDPTLTRSARDLVAKLSASIPEELKPVVLDGSLKAMNFKQPLPERFDSAELRRAIRGRQKLRISYEDKNAKHSTRVIWPMFIGYLEHVRLIAAWCETRQAFRNFRTDRIHQLEVLPKPYPARRAQLIRDWEAEDDAPEGRPQRA